jgi:hypothetical protein
MKHDRIMTQYRKSKMHLSSLYCLYCEIVIETKLHVLWDCPKCKGVWMCNVDQQSRELFFNSDLQQWIKLNINGVIGGIGIENW